MPLSANHALIRARKCHAIGGPARVRAAFASHPRGSDLGFTGMICVCHQGWGLSPNVPKTRIIVTCKLQRIFRHLTWESEPGSRPKGLACCTKEPTRFTRRSLDALALSAPRILRD